MLREQSLLGAVRLPSSTALALSALLFIHLFPTSSEASRVLLKGGSGTGGYSSSGGGYSSSGGSYSSGSSYYQQPYYGSTYGGSGYYGRPGVGYYGNSYGTSTSRGGSSLFWWLIAPLGLLLLFCICCKKARRPGHGAPMHGLPMGGPGMPGFPNAPPPPRHARRAYSAMRKSNAAFLRGSTPGPYLGTPNPVPPSVNGRQFQLREIGRTTRWIGSYTENGVTRHTRYELFFQQQAGYSTHEGRISGSGADDDGGFTLEGDYNLKTARFVWREAYPSGMKAAVQQQGSAHDGTFISAMAGTFCADTGLSGGLSLAPDIDAAFPAPGLNMLNPQAVLGGNNHHYETSPVGYPPAALPGAGHPPPGYPSPDSNTASHYAPSAPSYPPAPPGTNSYFAYPPAYGTPVPNQAAPWMRGIIAEPADPEPKPSPQV